MNKQRICIVGDGLTGLMTALMLDQLPGVEVNLVAKKVPKKIDRRTTAISETNYKFIRENIAGINSKLFWPSKNIELFYETAKEKINFLNLYEKDTNLMHVFENEKIKKVLQKKIFKKKIKFIRKEIKDLEEFKKNDLTILCLGGNSKIYNKISIWRSIKKDYKEVAITGYVKHRLKNLNTSQFFLQEGPIAILPFSKNHFSFVWSVKKDFYEKNIKKIDNLVKKKISELLKTNQNINLSNIQSYPISLHLKRQYYKNNILILGEGLHSIHPVAGQGFNLVLRDIKKLKKIISYYTGLGISINNSFALKDFNSSRKSENIVMGLGVDATHNFFRQNKYLDPLKELIVKNIDNSETLKRISKIISNKGLSF